MPLAGDHEESVGRDRFMGFLVAEVAHLHDGRARPRQGVVVLDEHVGHHRLKARRDERPAGEQEVAHHAPVRRQVVV